jgi:D-galactonate transporter
MSSTYESAAGAAIPAGVGQRADDEVFKKVTWRLIPFLGILWVLAWIDRVNIGFAKLQMLNDLHFSEYVYGLGAGIFFLGYFFFEVPSNLYLQKIGARATIARITIGWGVICVAQMFVTTPLQFYILRFLLGAFEAGFYPGIIFYLTYWYPTERRAKAFGMFMSASAIAGVIGGPLAGWIMTGLAGAGGWAGWQWLFLIEGVPSVIAGFVTLAYLTDKPGEASWLDAREKKVIADALAEDHRKLGARHESLGSVFSNGRVWILIMIYFCLIAANSTLTFWAPSIIRDVGFSSVAAVGWIAGAIYLCGAIGMVANGFHSDKHNEVRLHFGLAALIGALGMALCGLFLAAGSPIAALVALAIATVGTMSAIPVFWQLPNRFLSGTAAAAGVALINSVANLAGFGAPFAMGWIKDVTGKVAPGLFGVSAVELMATVLVLLCIPKVIKAAKARA